MFPRKRKLGMERKEGRGHTGFVGFSKVLFVRWWKEEGLQGHAALRSCFCHIHSSLELPSVERTRSILVCFVKMIAVCQEPA